MFDLEIWILRQREKRFDAVIKKLIQDMKDSTK